MKDKIKEKVKKIYKSPYFPILVLFIVQLIFNLFATADYGDDPWFADCLNYTGKSSIWEYLSYRWNEWTARIIMEFLVVTILKFNAIFWKILNALLYALLTYSISRIFAKPNLEKSKLRKINAIICCLFMLIELGVLAGAGYYTTFMFYLLPAALTFYALIYARKILLNEKIYKFEYILFTISTIIAANMEQSCCILLAVFALTFLFNIIKNKKIKIFNLILIIIAIIELVLVAVCPGNQGRYDISVATSFPEYENFTFINKIEMGIYSVLQCCFKEFNLLFVLFNVVVAIEIFKNYKNIFIRAMSIIPIVFGVAFTLCSSITSIAFPNFYNAVNEYFNNYTQIALYERWMFIMMIPLICSFLSSLLIFKLDIKTLIIFLVYSAGLTSRFMMGFSPTVIVSGSRTAIFLLCSFMVMIVMIVQEKDEKYINNFLSIVFSLAVINMFERFSTLQVYNKIGKEN